MKRKKKRPVPNDYTPSELYSLYMQLKDVGFRGLRPFFFKQRSEPPVKEAMEALRKFNQRGRSVTWLEIPDKLYASNQTRSHRQEPLYVLYKASLSNMPLYMGSKVELFRCIAQWRLGLGK